VFKDLRGREFGEWRVLERVKGGYLCRCKGCGTEKKMRSHHLTAGLSKGCVGCSAARRTKLVYVEGDVRGTWLVLGTETRDSKNKRGYPCRCQKCGHERWVRCDDLTETARCHLCSKKKPEPKTPSDRLVGQKFGRLTVIRETKAFHGKSNVWGWECICDCGNLAHHDEWYLRHIAEPSCGCGQGRKKERSSRWKGCGEISGGMWDTIRRGAKGRGVSVDVTLEEIWEAFVSQNGLCAYTGEKLVFSKRQKDDTSTTASLDRIDSRLGYRIGNIQWVHKDANKMKMDIPDDEFVELCRLVEAHRAIPANAI
jgi:hypothetical protein